MHKIALAFVPLLALAAGDPYDYKELTTTASHPVEIRPGLYDFGKDGIGWLELHAAEPGLYTAMIGEMTNAEGHVANPYPGSTIRCQQVSGWAETPVHRFRMPADPWNLIGYDIDHAPAIALPKWAQIVFPFRYVEVRHAAGALRPENLVRKTVHYPIDMAQSSFACDNGTLNAVYELCKYSILATSFCGIYVDGDRERTPYEADAYINQLCQYAIDADYSLGRRSFEWLMAHPTWPTEWKQHMIKMAWADWMWTGDTRSIAKHWKQLTDEKLLSGFARQSDGLLLTGGEQRKGCVIPGGGDIVDWPPAERDGFEFRPVNGVINAFHYRNLLELSQMARALGRAVDAEGFADRAKAVRASFRKVLLDAETGLFTDGEGSSHSSLHVNAAALAFGLADSEEMPRIVAFLEKKGLACSVYFAQYLLEAFCAAGRADIAVRLMASAGDRSWKGMIDFGSTITMEAWNMKVKPNQDLNHAWGSVPLNIISRCILGVTPLKPGFDVISIAPQPGGLRKIAARVPTAKGCVSIDIDGDRLKIRAPAPAHVVWQGKVAEVGAGEYVYGATEGAKFISPAEKREGHTVASFCKDFRNMKAVRKATLAATALGVFEVEINGSRVGNEFLKPGFTGCGQCRHVYTYDVTDLLKREADAENEIIAQVAPTWWCDQINMSAKPTPWQLGKEVAFRCELKLDYEDGSQETVRTGPDWLSAYSACTQTAGLYEGEVYDSRESIDWLKPAKVNTEFRGELRPAPAKIALREDLTLEPKAIYVTCGAEGATEDAYGRAKVVRRYRDGEKVVLNPGEQLVVDFGQNCSAVPLFQFSGRAGTQLEIRHAEMLNESNGEKSRGNDGPAGTPYLASLRSAYAGIRYTFAGGGDTYRPSFTFFGYRYLGVTTTAPVTFQRIRSVPVSSITKEMERGTITTGDRRINRLIENIRWGLRSNYVSIPTDCPQRDERLGWTADAQVFMNSAAYLTDTYGFLRKYLADLRDGQYEDGLYTCFVPNVRHVFPHWASCGWTDAGVIMPYRLWKWYGRTEVIDECWDSMEKYMSFLRTHEMPYRIDHADWLAYEHVDKTPAAGSRGQDPKYKKVMNAYFHYWMADLMRQMAEITGRLARAAAYAEEEAKLKKAFVDEYVDEDGCIKDYWKGQCSDLYMLKLGLCGNAAAVEATKKDLIDNIRAHGNRLQTGFLGTAILMPTLTFEANAPDVAYDLLFQDQDPSWLYSVDQGATTVWERWNSYTKEKGFGPTSMNSFNHYAYGCVLEWLFSAAAGIRPDPNQPGWKHFILQPFADRRLGHLEASYDSPVGRITSAWKYDADGKLHWSFSIPAGATAMVIAPDGTRKEYVDGAYEL